MDNWERTLRDEFDAADGSFLSQLRCQLHWDKIAFARLVSAMECCAKAHEGRGTVERWMANGFGTFAGSFRSGPAIQISLSRRRITTAKPVRGFLTSQRGFFRACILLKAASPLSRFDE